MAASKISNTAHIVLFVILVIVASYSAFLGLPFVDSVIITVIIPLFLFILYAQYKITEQPKTNGFNAKRISIVATFIFGIIALQAAWPIFMPRISLEDTNIERAIIYENLYEYPVTREAIVKIKPPLIPIIMERDYPIAQNLKTVTYDGGSPNLNISNGGDGRSIHISLKRVTGWSFDELIGKIAYQADKPFTITAIGKNISSVRETDNLQGYELYPYDYRAESMRIENPNTFPVETVNYAFWIEKDTPAWNSLKKWADDGFCISPLYSEQWDYRSSNGVMNVNGQRDYISKNTFNASNITLQVFYIGLKPKEQKEPNIIFKETTCGTPLRDISPRTPYIISGRVTSKESLKYLTMIIKNVNTGELDTEFTHPYDSPNKEYIYDLANLPSGYRNGDLIQISVCRNAQSCIASRNITIDMKKGVEEADFEI